MIGKGFCFLLEYIRYDAGSTSSIRFPGISPKYSSFPVSAPRGPSPELR